MNLPNKLTILRIVIIPLFVLFLYVDIGDNVNSYIAALLFIVASLTDLLDGKIARKYNLVTNFGKFMDPLADKLLVCSALIALVDIEKLAGWIVIIIIARDFIINGLRVLAADNGIVIAASYWGKLKTTCQMIMIVLLIVDLDIPYMYVINNFFVYIALILTIISLFDYIYKNYKVLMKSTNNV
ncbi:MAG: CDP-diacylglycerol--glycerol-3-phosphate 3-phosphatidyltransferase [Lachnospira sp.]|jgi:CDP-diacylglycerol--glycerol-3-phosphate 3-phosphatidyltransferase|nr:CDP-diacylglycerol--glycerol-3-phosphate 3-phosphatidyltransferase [Lachnospira sp.]